MDRPAYPKPKDQKKPPKPAVKVYADRREVCNMNCKEGRDIYAGRVREMWERQNRKCGLQISPQCKARNGRLLINEATFDHSQCRGMGGAKRTDRIWDESGRPMNMAVCCFCNSMKSSRSLSDFMKDIIP